MVNAWLTRTAAAKPKPAAEPKPARIPRPATHKRQPAAVIAAAEVTPVAVEPRKAQPPKSRADALAPTTEA